MGVNQLSAWINHEVRWYRARKAPLCLWFFLVGGRIYARKIGFIIGRC